MTTEELLSTTIGSVQSALEQFALESAVAQARSDLARIRIQAKAQENTAINDRDTKQAVLKQEWAKYNEIKTQIEQCTILPELPTVRTRIGKRKNNKK